MKNELKELDGLNNATAMGYRKDLEPKFQQMTKFQVIPPLFNRSLGEITKLFKKLSRDMEELENDKKFRATKASSPRRQRSADIRQTVYQLLSLQYSLHPTVTLRDRMELERKMLRMEEVFRQYDREFLKSRTTPNFKESKVNEGSMARAVTRITTLQTEIDEMVAPMQINLKKSRPWEDIAHIRQSSSAESIRGALMLVKFGDDAIKQVPNIMAALGNLPSILKFVMGEKEAMVSIDEHINEKERMDTLKTAVEQPLQKSWRQRYLESDKYKNSKQYKRIQLKTKAANKEILEYTAKYTFGPMTTEVMRNKVMRDAEFLYLQKQVARMKTTVTKRIPGGRSNPAAVELDRGIDNELLYKHQMLESDAINAPYEHRTGLMATNGRNKPRNNSNLRR